MTSSIVTVSVRLPQELARASAAVAALHGLSRSQYMCNLLAQHLAQDETAQTLIQLNGKSNGKGGQRQNGSNSARSKEAQRAAQPGH